MLYRAINGDGRRFFAYIVCELNGYNKMLKDHELGAKIDDLRQYGEVIYIDFIAEPDQKAQAFLEKYLAEHGA